MAWQVAQTILTAIGALSSIWFVVQQLNKKRRITWRFVERSTRAIVREMGRRDYSPSLILGIGRGGAIMGALISGALGHRPLIVVDRKYQWNEGRRSEDFLERLKISTNLERVLLVSGEVHSGNTMRMYHDYLQVLGAQQVERATLYYQTGATEPIEYRGFESNRTDLRLPWMFSSEYRRDDRSYHERQALKE